MSPTPCVLQLWHELCDLISQNPDKVQSLNVDAIIRGGLNRFTDQLGKLWCSLADYYIRSGHFEKVCEVSLEDTQSARPGKKHMLCVTHHIVHVSTPAVGMGAEPWREANFRTG